MPLAAGHKIGPYQILSLLGAGGMGEVYRAQDTRLNRQVALKVLPPAFANDPERMARFTREAQTLAALNHPNIAAIHGIEGNAIVMELVEGHDLKGPLPIDEALPIARQIADALEAAHERGIVHRDLKPANIKITPQGAVKLLDFGLAKAINEDPDDNSNSPTMSLAMTSAGVILGTAAYMAPEQARGKKVDRRADIWAFGLVLLETLTGRQTYTGETIADTLASVMKEAPDLAGLPASTPPAIRKLIGRCLEKDPVRRLSWIGEARHVIDDSISGVQPEIAATPASKGTPLWATALLGVAALAGLAGTALHLRETRAVQPMVRFQVPPPEKGAFRNGGFALSPDGRKLAFIASDQRNIPMIFVRPLDAVQAVPVAGTEGAASNVFWSPDSRHLAFLVGSRLVRIDSAGGPSMTLCTTGGNPIIGGAWSSQGVILYGTNTGGLWRVSQSGGNCTHLTKPDTAHGEFALMRPSFLPDGQHFLYVTRRPNMNNYIYLASLDGGQPKKLADSNMAGQYVPPQDASANGHLLFMRQGTLMALPLNPKTFDPAGEPAPLAQQVGSRLALGYFSVSQNGVLAFRSGGAGSQYPLIWFDRSGKRGEALGPALNYSALALSRDGKRLAVSGYAEPNSSDVWTMDLARGIPTRLTFNPWPEEYPAWSPDGAYIAYSAELAATGSAAWGIYRKPSNGSGSEELLYQEAARLFVNDWSPDGKYILFGGSPRIAGPSQLWLLPLSGAKPEDRKPISYVSGNAISGFGKFSPDGRWVAYTSEENGSAEVYVQSIPSGGGKFQISTNGGTQPVWRADGSELYYLAGNGYLTAVEVQTSSQFQMGKQTPLFYEQLGYGITYAARYAVTNDGKRILGAPAKEEADQPITVVMNWTAMLKK
jgi:Tol biopolymer transport system component